MATLLLDCDGPLSRCIEESVALVNRRFGKDYDPENFVTRWDLFSLFADEEAAYLRDCWTKYGFWTGLPVQPGARDAVGAIRMAGHNVVIVTSPYAKCRRWAEARLFWLKRNFDVDEENVIIAHQKWRVAGDVFIDDKQGNVEDWKDHNPGCGLVYGMAHNAFQSFSWHRSEVKSLIQEMDFA